MAQTSGSADGQVSRLIVSALLVSSARAEECGSSEHWVIYDGQRDFFSDKPASQVAEFGIEKGSQENESSWEIEIMSLVAVVSQVTSAGGNQKNAQDTQHTVMHMKRDPAQISEADKERGHDWVLCNDFRIQYTDARDVVTFDEWRHPCVTFFARGQDDRIGYDFGAGRIDVSGTENALIPQAVLQLPSASQTPCIRLDLGGAGPGGSAAGLFVPTRGEIVAFDGEFVSVELEKAEVNAEGQRQTVTEARSNLARISLVKGGAPDPSIPGTWLGAGSAGNTAEAASAPPAMEVICDDYIIPSETVLDYLTRFSGIVAEDLQPSASRNAVVHNRSVSNFFTIFFVQYVPSMLQAPHHIK